jgi:drug/metabolite transporter (DMT)-like permease
LKRPRWAQLLALFLVILGVLLTITAVDSKIDPTYSGQGIGDGAAAPFFQLVNQYLIAKSLSSLSDFFNSISAYLVVLFGLVLLAAAGIVWLRDREAQQYVTIG